MNSEWQWLIIPCSLWVVGVKDILLAKMIFKYVCYFFQAKLYFMINLMIVLIVLVQSGIFKML